MQDDTREIDAIETSSARIWLGADGILRVIVNPGTRLTLADIKEHLEATQASLTSDRLPVLVDISRIKSISREARAYMSGERAKQHIAAHAVLVGSPLTRVIANFALGLSRTSYPTKIFSSEAEALRWLATFCE